MQHTFELRISGDRLNELVRQQLAGKEPLEKIELTFTNGQLRVQCRSGAELAPNRGQTPIHHSVSGSAVKGGLTPVSRALTPISRAQVGRRRFSVFFQD